MEIIRKFWPILIIGLILRLLVAAFSYHPDTKSQVIASRSFLNGNFDPYQQADTVSKGAVLDKLPMSYFIQLPFHIVGRILTSNEVEDQFFIEQRNLFGKPQLWLYLIYSKLPLIIFDLALGVLLALTVSSLFQKKALYLWIFNPFTLWATEAVGQIDVYSAFFILLSFYFLKKGKLPLSALSLGFGGAVKTAPFLLLPLLLIFAKDSKSKLLVLFLSVIPYISSVIWFMRSPHFRNDAFVAPQIGKSLFAQISLSGGESVFIYFVLLIFIYFIYFQKNRGVDDFLRYSIVIFLLTLSLTHFHIQWVLWVIPFLIIWLLENIKGLILSVVGLVVSLVVMLFLFEASLQVKLFAPLFSVLDSSQGLAEILNTNQLHFLKSLAASIFAGCSAILSFKILQKK